MIASLISTLALFAPRALGNIAALELGKAGDFVLLAKAGISTISSDITGDIGVSPIAATAMTGFSLTLAGPYSESPQVRLIMRPATRARAHASPVPSTLTTASRAIGDRPLLRGRLRGAHAVHADDRHTRHGGSLHGRRWSPE
jgi:hypothetical protein